MNLIALPGSIGNGRTSPWQPAASAQFGLWFGFPGDVASTDYENALLDAIGAFGSTFTGGRTRCVSISAGGSPQVLRKWSASSGMRLIGTWNYFDFLAFALSAADFAGFGSFALVLSDDAALAFSFAAFSAARCFATMASLRAF